MYALPRKEVNGICKRCRVSARLEDDEMAYLFPNRKPKTAQMPLRPRVCLSGLSVLEQGRSEPVDEEVVDAPCAYHQRPHCTNQEMLDFIYSTPNILGESSSCSHGREQPVSVEQREDDELSYLTQHIGTESSYLDEIYLDLPSLDLSPRTTDRHYADPDRKERRKHKSRKPNHADCSATCDKQLQTEAQPPCMQQVPTQHSGSELSTKRTDVVQAEVLVPIVIKTQELLVKTRLEQIKLMKQLMELPDQLGKVLKNAAKLERASKAVKAAKRHV